MPSQGLAELVIGLARRYMILSQQLTSQSISESAVENSEQSTFSYIERASKSPEITKPKPLMNETEAKELATKIGKQ
jgi:hypothetical protein